MKYSTRFSPYSTTTRLQDTVPIPTAPSATLGEVAESLKTEIENARDTLQAIGVRYKREAIIGYILMETGARISEVLQLRHSDIDLFGRIRISGQKGSDSRIMVAPSAMQFLLNEKKVGGSMFHGINRHHIYRLFKLYGLGVVYRGNTKQSMTHYFRHLNAITASHIAADTGEIARVLGLRNLNNVEYYTKPRK